MKKVLTIGLVTLFACAPVFAADTAMAPATKATDTKAPNSQQSKMTMCQAQAGDKKLEGKARQDYVNNCLKAKPAAAEKPKSKMAMCNEKTKGMTKDEADKTRSECMKG